MENKSPGKSYIYSIDMAGMTIALLVAAAAMLIPLAVFRFDILKATSSSPFFIIAIAFWFILHEIIHGLFYRMSKGIKNKDIAFGARIEKGVLFCLCKKPISKNEIIRSLLAPLILIGFVTLIIGFSFNLDLLIILSLMNICGAMGDILMTLFIVGMPKIPKSSYFKRFICNICGNFPVYGVIVFGAFLVLERRKTIIASNPCMPKW